MLCDSPPVLKSIYPVSALSQRDLWGLDFRRGDRLLNPGNRRLQDQKSLGSSKAGKTQERLSAEERTIIEVREIGWQKLTIQTT